jgi:hypothetical protein
MGVRYVAVVGQHGLSVRHSLEHGSDMGDELAAFQGALPSNPR